MYFSRRGHNAPLELPTRQILVRSHEWDARLHSIHIAEITEACILHHEHGQTNQLEMRTIVLIACLYLAAQVAAQHASNLSHPATCLHIANPKMNFGLE